jgi:hypothetical protein
MRNKKPDPRIVSDAAKREIEMNTAQGILDSAPQMILNASMVALNRPGKLPLGLDIAYDQMAQGADKGLSAGHVGGTGPDPAVGKYEDPSSPALLADPSSCGAGHRTPRV